MTMIFSEERGTWNIFTEEGEWYYEGTYEECCKIMDNAFCEDSLDEYYEEVPNDYYG